MLIMHEQAFGDYLTDHSFLSLESVGWKTGCCSMSQDLMPLIILKAARGCSSCASAMEFLTTP